MMGAMRRPLRHRLIPILIALGLLVSAGYIAWSAHVYRVGFPLDDAWIHQTYARNLATRGEWSFLPGVPSAGTTSPLWTILLSVGYWIRLDPRFWAFALGTAALVLAAWLAGRWAQDRSRGASWIAAAVGLTVVLEWHLVWSAVSGMETLVLAAAAVVVFLLLERKSWSPLQVGVVIGIGVWARPDALTLLGPAAWHAWMRPGRHLTSALRDSAIVAVGMACGLVPYLVFLRLVGGSWWPSTFFAKQAEYAVLTSAPVLVRLLALVRAPLAGVGGLLAIGVVLEAIRLLKMRSWAQLAPALWAAGYLVVYALRLPVAYQHGRYQIPILPTLIVLGWCGIAPWFAAGVDQARWIAGRVWLGAAAVVLLMFLVLGGRAYAEDVAIIESEMVDTAHWVADHTEPEAVVAAHDIGALGYFGQRSLVDLAGLTDPELIPILRDEAALAREMKARRVSYLVTFPNWYPLLSACGQPVYTSPGAFAPAAGGESMVVYRWAPASFAARPTCMLYSP
jgi:hypothetical protein